MIEHVIDILTRARGGDSVVVVCGNGINPKTVCYRVGKVIPWALAVGNDILVLKNGASVRFIDQEKTDKLIYKRYEMIVYVGKVGTLNKMMVGAHMAS